MSRFFLSLLMIAAAFGQTVQPDSNKSVLSTDAIMVRLAANQDRSQALRKEYICKEHTHIVTHKPGGKLMREETADYEIVPSGTGSQTQLKLLKGRYWHNGKYEDFNGEPIPDAN